jgi:hypothetical protein
VRSFEGIFCHDIFSLRHVRSARARQERRGRWEASFWRLRGDALKRWDSRPARAPCHRRAGEKAGTSM